MNFTKKQVIILLITISLIAIPLKLYTVEFSLPVQFDNLGYTLDSLQYSEGDFFVPPKKNPGWPLFASPFMSLVNSENFLDYSNLMRTLSLGISVFTILDPKSRVPHGSLLTFQITRTTCSKGRKPKLLVEAILITSKISI